MGFIPRADQKGGIDENIPGITAIPPSVPTRTELVEIVVTTVISNVDKHHYSGVPLRGSKPTCTPLTDGSLVCPTLIKDLLQVYAILVICSVLFVFLFRNAFTVVRYIRSGNVPQKALFYILLGSQVIGFVFPLPTIISIFAERVDCRSVEVLSTIFHFLSLSLLVTGILGIKTYRCLNSSKFVLVGLVLLRTASMTFTILDMINLDVGRRLSGSCIRESPMTYVAGATVSQLGELVFINCCFAWGFWRTNGSRPGRLTIPDTPTLSNAPNPNPMASEDLRRRGWWDYVPDDQKGLSKNSEIASSDGTRSIFGGSPWHSDQLTKHRKPSLRTAYPLSYPGRELGRSPRFTSRLSTYAMSITASSLVSKLGLQIKTFKNLLRNELASTSVITLLQGATSMLTVTKMGLASYFPAYCLSMITWVAISQLLLLTFDRVIRRHEKEAMLRNPGYWDTARREVQEVFRVPITRESSLLSSSNLPFPDTVTHRSARVANSIVSDPFTSRRNSWSSRTSSSTCTEKELLSRLDPMFEGPASVTSLSTMSPECPPPPPAPLSPRSTVGSTTHTFGMKQG